MRFSRLAALSLGASAAAAYRVSIADTDNVREVCSGMYGGSKAYIQIEFQPEADGQVALVVYEWGDAKYIGVDTPDSRVKTYICTNSAVRAGLCKDAQLGSFISSAPEDAKTSIYSIPLKFTNVGSGATTPEPRAGAPLPSNYSTAFGADVDEEVDDVADPTPYEPPVQTEPGEHGNPVQVYSSPIQRPVGKTGYYCVGVVPVTLVDNERGVEQRKTTHAAYKGIVTFRNQFDGELPAVEYPKIGFYGGLSIVYLVLAIGWGILCARHYRELLPMQYYISGTVAFLVVEMLALFAYYRYINKHGGGAASIAFLCVVSVLNAARNSLSFFLLLIVSMGLSVVTQSLGSVMIRVWALTAAHFVFGMMYAIGTVKVELDSASILIVLFLIFPLSLTLTGFLMWIIVSLNGTILHLQERKQHFKLQMFQRLYRILITAVIAVGAFFVLSSISLSNRLDEDYTPRNWRWRWILLDASLALIYLAVFIAIAWLWRPTEENIRFATSTELAQDEADAEDYEIGDLEAGGGGGDRDGALRLEPVQSREFVHGEQDERKGFLSGYSKHTDDDGYKPHTNDEDVVFAMGDDSEEEDVHEEIPLSREPSRGEGSRNLLPPRYRDEHKDKDD